MTPILLGARLRALSLQGALDSRRQAWDKGRRTRQIGSGSSGLTTMHSAGTFPFGRPIERVEQDDRGPKRVFVLGVYASAVHARWMNRDGKQLVVALAVASEPYIFWRGEGADEIVSRVTIPEKAGRLEPAGCHLNVSGHFRPFCTFATY